MADDNPDKKQWLLPKPNLNQKVIVKNLKKVETATLRHTHKFIIKRWGNVREVQSRVIFWIIAMGLLIAATGFQLMWYQQSYLAVAPSADSSYAEAVIGPVNTLNPIFASTSAEQSAGYLMFSSILRYDKSGRLNHDLATNVAVNTEHTKYTVDIRPDAKWTDGVSLTTKDILFTIALIKNSETNSIIAGWDSVSVNVISDTTIEFTLPSTYAAFQHALTFPVLPEHILGNVTPSAIRENDFSQNPVGSGPFMLRFVQNVDTNAGRKVIYLARNDQYYGGTASLAKLQLNVYNTTGEIISALSSNAVDATADLSPIDIDQVDTDKYSISVSSIQSGVYAIFNMKSVLLNDLGLRQALRSATNTQVVLDKLPEGTLPLSLPFTANQLTGEIPSAPAYDLVSAKKILDDAGWILNADNVRFKDGRELKISVVAMKGNEFEAALEALAGQWRAVGFTVETKVLDPSDATQNIVQSILQPRNFDVLIYRLDIGADPDVYAYWDSNQATVKGLNFSNYSNIISDDALASARSRVEPDIRNAKYITFAKQWLVDVPAVGLYQSTLQYVYRNNVHALEASDVLISPVDRFSDVLDWSVGSRTVYKTP
jgi:peptide/nickel transport system substrate-binding protein